MKIKVSLQPLQLQLAVKYIVENNAHVVKDNLTYDQKFSMIESSIRSSIQYLCDSHIEYIGTYGYTILGDWQDEDMDCDETLVHVEIMVSPSLKESTNGDEYIFDEFIINTVEK